MKNLVALGYNCNISEILDQLNKNKRQFLNI